MNKALLIYNPLSGQRSVPYKIDHIIARFMNSNVLVQPYRTYNIEENKLLSILNNSKYSYVVISGGDGTINAVVNIMLKNNINLPIGIIPSGTCNDFARSLEIPSSLDKCLDIILSGNTLEIDVGIVNGKEYFLNTCAGGILVDISYSTSGELKRNIGPLAYYLKALSEMANIRPFNLKLTANEQSMNIDALMFIILNGRHAAGFNNIAGKADLTDGLMDIIIIKNCWHIDMAGILLKVLANDLMSHRSIISLKTKSCVIEGNNNVALTLDGEKGPNLPISVEFIHKCLSVFIA
ncbi:MAG TPA: YegS/Rv2252/BmrU family lipid kinase [Clostridiaceae bacterium]|jgi:diacylglycerol kinase (ATP)|nr:YegS/Rv2252/BmrU family lipid kinase [Clostridiaceae bacterium]